MFLSKNNVPLTDPIVSEYKSSHNIASDNNLTGRIESVKDEVSPAMQVALIEKAVSQGEFLTNQA